MAEELPYAEEAIVTRTRGWQLAALLMAAGMFATAAAQNAEAPAPARSQVRERNLHAYIELLRSDLRTQKIALITEVMQFTEQEDAAFWPLYRDYEFDLSRLNDDRVRLIDRYAEVYSALTDATADELVTKALDVEARRTALKQKYYARLKTALPWRTAARVIQVENQIQLLMDLQIAASLPIARDAEGGVR
jgi:hypothetical protein